MKKWYKESYFERKNWILENFDRLNLSAEETVLILLIDLCRTGRKQISYEFLSTKLGKPVKEIDAIIASLVSKHYLKLSTNARGIIFDIDGIFEFDPDKYEIAENRNLYDIVGDVFGKPLTPVQLQKMNDLLETYGQDKFNEALRLAEAHRKLSMSYIEGILRNDKKRTDH